MEVRIMKSIFVRSLFSLALLAACGDDSGGGGTDGPPGGSDGGGGDAAMVNCAANGGADCFELPTAAMTKAATTTLANFSCAPETIDTRTESMTVAGNIVDFQTGNDLPNATIKAFYTAAITGAPDAMATADATGAYTITLATGAKSRMNWLMEDAGGLPTYALNVPLDVTMAAVTGYDRENVSMLTANALPAFIGHARTPGLGVVAGVVEDCDGEVVQHAIGTIASASSDGSAGNIAFVPGAEVYYFISGLPTRRNQRGDTNTDGVFVVIEIPVASQSFLQVWGFTAEADVAMGAAGLKLVAELPVTVLGDAVLAVGMNPSEGPL
jgi:hypothetical protein